MPGRIRVVVENLVLVSLRNYLEDLLIAINLIIKINPHFNITSKQLYPVFRFIFPWLLTIHHKLLKCFLNSGGNTEGATPGTIPNPEVKSFKADDTALK